MIREKQVIKEDINAKTKNTIDLTNLNLKTESNLTPEKLKYAFIEALRTMNLTVEIEKEPIKELSW